MSVIKSLKKLYREYLSIINKPDSPFLREQKLLKKYEIGRLSHGYLNVKSWEEESTLKVGSFCSFAYGITVFLGGEHRTDWGTTYAFNKLFPKAKDYTGHPLSKGDVTIGNDVWIGQEAMILSGVTIGDGAIIGAKSVVRRNIPSYAIVAGNPAIFTGYRFDKSLIKDMLKIAWWDWPIEKIEESWPLMLSTNIKEFVEKYKIDDTTQDDK